MSKKLKITELGDKILRAKAKVVSAKDLKTKKFQDLIDNMIKTCDVNSGVGIAAPQVNEGLRLFILWPERKLKNNFRAGKSISNKRYLPVRNFSSEKYLLGEKVPPLGPIAIINPKIISSSKKIIKSYEGCLSIPGIRGLVPRHKSIDVEFITREGEKLSLTLEDFPARIFQHEYDHLNGIVFLDRTDPKDLVTEKEYQKILKKKK